MAKISSSDLGKMIKGSKVAEKNVSRIEGMKSNQTESNKNLVSLTKSKKNDYEGSCDSTGVVYVVKVPLPTYINKGKKKVLSLNSYRNMNYHLLNGIKSDYGSIYENILEFKKFKEVKIEYVLYFSKHLANRRDLMNYGSMLDKIFCDSVVKRGMLDDDTISFVKEVKFIYGGYGDEYARVKIKEVK